MQTLSDFDLVRQTCAGATEAFTELVHRYRKPLIALSMRYSNDLSQAEDIVQEAFLKAFEKIGTFQFRSAFKSWLYRIAINTAKNRLRKKKPDVNIDKVVLLVDPECEDNMIEAELLDKVREWVALLPEKQKRAMNLRVYGEMSFMEVAEIMKCPYDTAKANYRHGLMSLRKTMKMAL